MFRLASALVLLATLADAGTIRLNGGSLVFESILAGDSAVNLTGSRGFSFEGHAQSAYLEAADCVFECDIGETYSVGMIVSGNDLPGVAELGAIDYVDVGGVNSWNTLVLTVSGTAKVPRMGAVDTKVQTVPVTFGGQFYHEAPVPLLPVIEQIVGKGRAIVTWTKYEDRDRSIRRIVYRVGR